jgi:hypothetical protein
MRSWLYSLFSLFIFTASLPALAQDGNWPKVIKTSNAEIRIFEFQPQSLNGNKLALQSALSVKENDKDPVFGMLWAEGTINKDQSGNVNNMSDFNVSNIKLPGVENRSEINELKTLLQTEIPDMELNIPMTQLLARIAANQKEAKLSAGINTNPPKIIYMNEPSMLVFIDGQPQIQRNTEWGVDQVVNTPFTIIKNNNKFYLYGNRKWYTANSITGSWTYLRAVPQQLTTIDKEIRNADTSVLTENTIPAIIVTTEPAELIQSKGEANFSPVQGTNLLYMTNTANDIFLDVNQQQYYVLISGRWYKAPNLNSSWTYISPDQLPEDFAKIPAGSEKDAVLASVAGTPQAEESLLDAEVPQTAKVDRSKATANVEYDGEPQFEPIEGTDLEYAVNTPGSVISDGRRYYYVENGVWFESNDPAGPWQVATERPDEVANIPPSSPVYNVKYVYIYDYTPDYVYMGYTPGYLGTYRYGPTIVYGTGYHYRPWRGRYYYARPLTWGFNMRYNPWTGWSFGLGMGSGWFFSEYGYYDRYYSSPSYYGRGTCWGGWWGPVVYRPQYSRPYSHYYGRNVVINNNYIIRSSNYNNIYRHRRDAQSYQRPVYTGSRNRTRDYAGNYNNRSNGGLNNNSSRPSRNDANGNISNNTRDRNRFGNVREPRFGTSVNPNRNTQQSGQPGISRQLPRNNGNVLTNPATNNNNGTVIGNRPQRNVIERENQNSGGFNERNTQAGNNTINNRPVRERTTTLPDNGNTGTNRNVLDGNRPQRNVIERENQDSGGFNDRNNQPGNNTINNRPVRERTTTLPENNNQRNRNVFEGNRPQRTNPSANPSPSDNNNGGFNRNREMTRPSTTPVNPQPVERRTRENRDVFGGGQNNPAPQQRPERVYSPQPSSPASGTIQNRPGRERNVSPMPSGGGGEVRQRPANPSPSSGGSQEGGRIERRGRF